MADLFSEEGKYPVEHTAKNGDSNESAQVLGGRIRNDGKEFIFTDNICQEEVGNQEGHPKKYAMFQCFSPDLIPVPGRSIQPNLAGPVPFDPVFHTSEDHFHKDGLGAGPPAPKAAEYGSKQYNKDDQRKGAKYQQVQILRPESHTENDELSFQDIKQEQGVPVDGDERPGKEENQQKEGYDISRLIVPPTGFCRKNPVALALFVDSGEVISE
jgi:hypothetical protein